jgi:uncharacterized protein affecting Mg2+/Co2+ transport
MSHCPTSMHRVSPRHTHTHTHTHTFTLSLTTPQPHYTGRQLPTNNHNLSPPLQNHGPVPLKCIGRHWYVIGEDGQLAGELPENLRTFSYDPPTLVSGACLEYHSAVDLEAAAGMMSGVMMFRDDQGRDFDVVVGPFALLSYDAARGTAVGRDSNVA